jgi:crotonobetainyl-CoA:carnitine CoA-transferase CaiB-like acyl-CoA transferase
MDHHEVGKRIAPGMPVKIERRARPHQSLPPDLGQHNREVFGGLLGLSDAEINLLIEEKVIY